MHAYDRNQADPTNNQHYRIYPLIMISTLLIPLITLALPNPVAADAFEDLWSQYQQQTEAKQYESTGPRRERNLDHWDVPTAAAYLGLHPETLKPLPQYADDEASSTSTSTSSSGGVVQQLTDDYAGHDAAILFYAQWCRNCHACAPSWDAIASHVNAGSKESNLVMALFDCEKNTKHTELCLAAGIKAYPTMMFVGSGSIPDTDVISGSILGKDRSAGPFGAKTLPRTVKFQGNWQYGDQILDWVNIMRGLSSWHSVTESGPLRFLRNGMFNMITGGKAKKYSKANKKGGGGGSIPVGIPPNSAHNLGSTVAGGGSAGGGSSSAEAAATAQEVKDLKLKLNITTQEKELYEKAVTHSSNLLDGLLFPNDGEGDDPTTGTKRDPFTILTNSDGWYQNATTLPEGASNEEHPTILRSCMMELTIDYCTRITTRSTKVYLEELNAIPESDPFPSMEEIEKRLMEDVTKVEPYCGLIESCMLGNFESEGCRPEKCPFENRAACHYVDSCLDPEVQDEYGLALGLIEKGEAVKDKDFGSSVRAAAADAKKDNAGVGGWGVPAN